VTWRVKEIYAVRGFAGDPQRTGRLRILRNIFGKMFDYHGWWVGAKLGGEGCLVHPLVAAS